MSKDKIEHRQRKARREPKSFGAVTREAVDAYAAQAPDRREAAIRRLLAIGAPVADWEVMKEEIARGALGDT